MEGKKEKSDNIKPSTRSAKSTTSENAGKSSKNEDSVRHVDGARDKAMPHDKIDKATDSDRSETNRDSPPELIDTLVKSIASLTESLKTVKENQDDMVTCMMAAGAPPSYVGKGKGRGKRSAPRDEESRPQAAKPTQQPSTAKAAKPTQRREEQPSTAKKARREEIDLNHRDSELDYSEDDSDNEVDFTSDDIENQIDAFLQTAQELGPPDRRQPPLLPLNPPGPSGSGNGGMACAAAMVEPRPEDLDASLASFAQDLITDEDMGPNINSQLADILSNLLGKKMSDDKVKARIEENPPPQNVPLLHPPRVNECIWELMRAAPRSTDIRLRKIQVRLTRGLVAMARLAEVLLDNKKKGTNPDLADCLNRCLQSFALLSNANYEISLRRRETLRTQLNPRYSRLCYPSTPVTSDLFGDDVTKLVEDITKVNKIGASIAQNYNYNNKGYNNSNNNNNNRYGQGNRGGRGRGSFRGKRGNGNQAKNGRWRGNAQKNSKSQ